MAIVLGANVGSTSTALVASISMQPVARAAAISNFLFNAVGVLLLPFMEQFTQQMLATGEPAMVVASAHLTFNLTTAGRNAQRALADLKTNVTKSHLRHGQSRYRHSQECRADVLLDAKTRCPVYRAPPCLAS